MADSDVPLHRYGDGEVGGSSQSNLADREQLGEQSAVQAVGPNAEGKVDCVKNSFQS